MAMAIDVSPVKALRQVATVKVSSKILGLFVLILSVTRVLLLLTRFHVSSIEQPPTPTVDHPTTHRHHHHDVATAFSTTNVTSKVNPTPAPTEAPRDGTFNRVPVYLKQDAIQSRIRCVGDNFQPHAWQSRSCEIQNLCFNTKKKEFVVFPSRKTMEKESTYRFKDTTVSTAFHNISVALGSSTAEQIGGYGPDIMKWFPDVELEPPESYYELPDDVVLVPFHGLAPHNPGHLIWDNFFPIHTLLSMFDLLQDHRHLLIRHVFKGKHLFGSCEAEGIDWMQEECRAMMRKFLRLMGNSTVRSFSTNSNFKFLRKKMKSNSPYVCAKRGVIGIGMLTDHGRNSHGFEKEDYQTSRFAGRGPLLKSFRDYAMNNIGLPTNTTACRTLPIKIVFSLKSSTDPERDITFNTETRALKKILRNSNDTVVIEAFDFTEMSAKEQIEVASSTSIYISAVGGGAVTATFLPKQASAVMFYGNFDGMQARLDWEILNNAGYFTSHWLAIEKRKTKSGTHQFVSIIQSEIERLQEC